MELEIAPLDAPLGAIVHGWDPGATLSDDERDAIARALEEYLVLVFRGQRQSTDEELIAFGSRFGELLKGSEFLERPREHPEILKVANLVDKDGKPEGTGGAAAMPWHSDYSYVDRVGRETFLNAVILPERPPHTCFVDQYRAYATLPDELKTRLEGLRAFHSVSLYYEDGGSEDVERYREDKKRAEAEGRTFAPIPEAEHPVVVRHPVTGREILYVSPAITHKILGLPAEESRELLETLHAHSTKPENVYAHDWQVGDLVLFDTLGTMHMRESWDRNETRYLRQMSTTCVID